MIKSIRFAVAKNFIRIILFVWSILVVYPVVWVMYSSFKSNRDFYESPWALPTILHFENYYNAWITSNFAAYMLNSLIVVLASLILSLLMSSTTSYILAKYKFRGLKIIENTYIGSMMIPSVLLLIPLFFQVKALHMTDKLSTLILLYAVSFVPFSVFMLMGFMKGIHDSYIEAAVMDGCSEFRVFFKVIAPMSKPGLFIIALLNIMGSWNEYVMALTFLSSENKFTVPIGLSYLSSTMKFRTDFGALFAGLVIAMVPILIIYGIFQRQLQEGMAAGGVKG